MAKVKTIDVKMLADPTYFKENRLPAHSDHKVYRNEEELLAQHSSLKHSLNGDWFFHYSENMELIQKDFYKKNVSCKSWKLIPVPAHIQLQGYDKPHYTNVDYPWEGHEEIKPGQIPTRFNPVAQYVKYFYVPQEWAGQPVCISFQGAESALAVWCNGEFVGYSEDSFTPSEFDLTPYLVAGENKLAAMVVKWSSSSWCEDQDFFRFSGIFRDVFLYTKPSVHVEDLKVVADALPETDYKDGKLELTVEASADGRADISVISMGRLDVAKPASPIPVAEETLHLSKGSNALSINLQNINAWSAEQPNLYEVQLRIFDKDKNATEIVSQLVGFRHFEIKDSIMMLNGKRIVFKGVNRHEFNCVSGRVPNEKEQWLDFMTMKQNNINAVRTSHYPNDSRIFEICDKLGIYMIDECNLESHGSWGPIVWGQGGDIEEIVPGNRIEWHDMMIDRATSMLQRDKNHAAILIWSCGNESFGGKNIKAMSDYFHAQDPTRIVHYEGVFNDRREPDISDVESQMYTSAADVEKWLAGDRSKPFIMCEYMHAMGNSCGAMHKYTDLANREPLFQGGFIWDYVDQTLTKKDRYGKEFQAYGGDFGDRPSDYEFSGNGIVYGDRVPSPKMQEVKYNYRSLYVELSCDGGVVGATITNYFLFTDAKEYDGVLELLRDGELVREESVRISLAPGKTKVLTGLTTLPNVPGEYVVRLSFRTKMDLLWAAAGHEVAFGQGVFRVGEMIPGPMGLTSPIKVGVPALFEVVRGSTTMGIRGENFELILAGAKGGLVSYKYGGVELLEDLPRPSFWRAPTDNDRGCDMMQRCGQWKLASLYATTHGSPLAFAPKIEPMADHLEVTTSFTLPMTPSAVCYTKYSIYGDGTVGITLSMDVTEEMQDIPEFGFLFKLNADYDNIEWYGNGPAETYEDRQMGGKLGIHTAKVADQYARYLVPQECGNHTKVRYAKVTNREGRGLIFVGNEMNFSALPWNPHELESATHVYELPQVHHTFVRTSLQQMGIGGDNSWGARPHDEYLLDKREALEFTVYFRGI